MTNDFLAFAPVSAETAPVLADTAAVAEAIAVQAAPAVAPIVGIDPAEVLDDMMARVGVDGLAAALADASLLAQVDQHAAAVREALGKAGRSVDAAGLAAYARSVSAAATRMGRPVPAPGQAYVSGAAWLAAEWHLMRLVAVCMIAEAADLL
jgi:hypothetical protein